MKPLRVLIVEDSENDALLMIQALRRGGYNPTYERVDTAPDMRRMLTERQWDIILSDYSMPHFDGLAAMSFLKNSGLDIPFIIVSGVIGEDTAAEMMKAGAHDYIMKNNLRRFIPAIERELRDAEVRRLRKESEKALIEAESCGGSHPAK